MDSITWDGILSAGAALSVFFFGIAFARFQARLQDRKEERQLHGLLLAQYYELNSAINALSKGYDVPPLKVLPELRKMYSLLMAGHQYVCDELEGAVHALNSLKEDTPGGEYRKQVWESFKRARVVIMKYLVERKALDNLIGEDRASLGTVGV